MKNMIHWNVFEGKWTSRTYKSCARHDTILVIGNWQTEVKKEKKDNPKGWVFAQDTQVIHDPSEELLSNFIKDKKLHYDKKNMKFSIEEGIHILFDREGCFTLTEVIK